MTALKFTIYLSFFINTQDAFNIGHPRSISASKLYRYMLPKGYGLGTLRGCLHRGWGGGRGEILELESGTTFRLLYRNFGRSGYQVEKEKKNNCQLSAAELPAAAMFVLFVPSTRIFRTKVVYMVLGSSYLSTRKILVLGPSTLNFLHVN